LAGILLGMSAKRNRNQGSEASKEFWSARVQRGEKVTTMAMQKKSVIGKGQSAKKALVAKRVSTVASKAEQVKAPFFFHLDAKKKKR